MNIADILAAEQQQQQLGQIAAYQAASPQQREQFENYLVAGLDPTNWATWKMAKEAETASRREEEMEQYLLAEMGLRYDEKGNLVRMTEEEQLALMTSAGREEYQIGKLMRERQRMALEGRLPLSPALEQEFADQQKTMDAEMSARLGRDWQTSTPGIQAGSRARQREGLIREETRRGMISQGEALSQGRRGLEAQIGGQKVGQYTQLPYTRMPLTGIYGNIGSMYQRDQEREAQEQAGLYGAWGQLLGAGMQSGATAYAGR